jgi:hypothetical protein
MTINAQEMTWGRELRMRVESPGRALAEIVGVMAGLG